MNSRRVHAIFNKTYPSIDLSGCEWKHVYSKDGIQRELLRQLMSGLPGDDYFVHAHRKLGNFLPKQSALDFVVEHIGKGTIRITDRAFMRL
ncbi:hypothetical protein [Caballeronia sp. LjRoot31]|uniref:hypothetical protein n=1 Tax=Caballeronia sp. LjRoot31 TaxID=3342324 RepID=UPI003ECCBB98